MIGTVDRSLGALGDTLGGAAVNVNFISTPAHTVHGEKDAVNEDGSIRAQGIDQGKLVPLLTAALKETLAEIASLKDRMTALETS